MRFWTAFCAFWIFLSRLILPLIMWVPKVSCSMFLICLNKLLMLTWLWVTSTLGSSLVSPAPYGTSWLLCCDPVYSSGGSTSPASGAAESSWDGGFDDLLRASWSIIPHFCRLCFGITGESNAESFKGKRSGGTKSGFLLWTTWSSLSNSISWFKFSMTLFYDSKARAEWLLVSLWTL